MAERTYPSARVIRVGGGGGDLVIHQQLAAHDAPVRAILIRHRALRRLVLLPQVRARQAPETIIRGGDDTPIWGALD